MIHLFTFTKKIRRTTESVVFLFKEVDFSCFLLFENILKMSQCHYKLRIEIYFAIKVILIVFFYYFRWQLLCRKWMLQSSDSQIHTDGYCDRCEGHCDCTGDKGTHFLSFLSNGLKNVMESQCRNFDDTDLKFKQTIVIKIKPLFVPTIKF